MKHTKKTVNTCSKFDGQFCRFSGSCGAVVRIPSQAWMRNCLGEPQDMCKCLLRGDPRTKVEIYQVQVSNKSKLPTG